MADEPIHLLPAAGPIADGDFTAVAQGGIAKSSPMSAVRTYATAAHKAELASTAGAGLVGLLDAGNKFSAGTVEAALTEVKTLADAAAPLAPGVQLIPSGGTAPFTFVSLNGGVLTDGISVGQADGRQIQMSKEDFAAWLYPAMFPTGLSPVITQEQGSPVWTQGGGAAELTAAAIDDASWTLTNPATSNDLKITFGGPLPDLGTYPNTAYMEYTLDNSVPLSAVWVEATGIVITSGALAAPNQVHNIAGLTNAVPANVWLRIVTDSGTFLMYGPPSATPKTETPTVPATYIPRMVNNVSSPGVLASIPIPDNALGVNSKYFNLAVIYMRTAGGDGTDRHMFATGNDRGSLACVRNNNNLKFRLRNPAGTYVCHYETKVGGIVNQMSRHVIKYDGSGSTGTPAVFEWWCDGALLTVTNNLDTGLVQVVAAICDTIEHNSGSAGGYLCAYGVEMQVGEVMMKVNGPITPAQFWDGVNPTDWGAIVGLAPQIMLGHQMTAAQWTASAANNLGSATIGNTTNPFIAVP